MDRQRRCRGCFAQMQEGASRCAFCGRAWDREKCRLGSWETGKVLEQRYTLGDLYQEGEHHAIWRAYDGVLDISCFLLRGREETEYFSEQEMGFVSGEERDYEMLGFRMIGGHPIWVFSMKNLYLPEDKCQIFNLFSPENPRKDIKVQAGHRAKNALPEDTMLADRYRVLGTIGIGGFGITYLCEDINMGRNVAVKEYFPDQWSEREGGEVSVCSSKMVDAFRYGKRAFAREMKLLAGFIHERFIVTVYDGFSANDTYYMVMEYLPGKSLGKIMRERGKHPLSIAQWKKIMNPVLEGLDTLHQCGILHGDISPGNIICTEGGEVRLIDLGSAREWKSGEEVFLTAFLKPDYASPEQYQTACTGKPGTEGPWSDIYSLGATMYYCLTGRKPPDIMERLEEGNDKMAFTARDKLRIPARWRELIGRCMEPDRGKRPQNIEEVRNLQ